MQFTHRTLWLANSVSQAGRGCMGLVWLATSVSQAGRGGMGLVWLANLVSQARLVDVAWDWCGWLLQ